MGPDVFAEVEALGVIPVVEVEDAAHAVPLARTLAEAGLPVLEVTFRTAAASDAIAAITAEFSDFLLGAGTLLTPDAVAAAVAAGARLVYPKESALAALPPPQNASSRSSRSPSELAQSQRLSQSVEAS